MINFEQYLAERSPVAKDKLPEKPPLFYTYFDILSKVIKDLSQFNCDLVNNRMNIFQNVEFTTQILMFPAPIGRVSGNFDASGIGLTSLQNGPTEVDGDFDVSKNKLTDLEYAPTQVRGSVYLSSNRLTTLEGDLETIGGDMTIRLQHTKNFTKDDVSKYKISVAGRVYYK